MNQPDLFAQPITRATQRRVRVQKAQDATDKADADEPKWSDMAYAYLVQFAAERDGEFLGEEVIYRSKGHVPEPANTKAWGSVFIKAARNGVICKAGWSSNTKNASPKPVWVRV